MLIDILGDIADFGIGGKVASTADTEHFARSLCTWIGNLPAELRLYDSAGRRRLYRQSVSEMYMVYLTTVILLEALRMRFYEQWSTSIPSIVAASCMARLIQEVDCREDLHSMSSTTTFYIMAGSIPLLYHHTSSPEKEEIRCEELGMLCSAIEQMSPKWGGASVVRHNIEKIRNLVDGYRGRSQNSGQDNPRPTGSTQSQQELEQMFPFAKGFCPNMELLDLTLTEQPDFDMTFLPLSDDLLPWGISESQPYLDLFGINAYADPFMPVEPFQSVSGEIA